MKEWDLTTIYTSLDSEEFHNDVEQLKKLAAAYIAFIRTMVADHENEKEKLEVYIEKKQELSLHGRKMTGYCQLVTSTNTLNGASAKASEMLQGILNKTVGAETLATAWISDCDLEQICDSSDLLKDHAFILMECRNRMAHQLSDREETIIAGMKQTGSDAWMRLKNQLIGSHTVEITVDGEKKELPLTVVLNMAYSADQNVRRNAYEAEIESYKKVENNIAACLSSIKGEVLCVSELRGYQSPLEMTLKNSRMDQETLDAMLSAMQEYLPVFRKYLRAKAAHLGYENGLPFFEIYAPVSDVTRRYTYEEACEVICRHFHEFDEDLGNMAERAIREHWIDVESRPGKVGGAFCSSVPSLKQSRVLLNFNGSIKSVVTMAHELGHAFHNECAKEESLLNRNTPMQLAETASTFNETMVKRAIMKSLSDEEALPILEAEICGCTQVIVDIYSRYLFETALFEARKEGAVNAAELCDMMKQAQLDSYGNGLDPQFLHPYMWTWKPHFYYAERNFYNFPYAFGQLFAKGLYAMYEKEGKSFIPKYKKLLASTGKMSIYDCCMSVGIDVRDIDFWRSSLEICKADIERFVKMIG